MEQFNNSNIIFAACDNSIVKTEEEKFNYDEYVDELKDSIQLFVNDAGMQKFYIYPNFNFGIFMGHQGYVAEVPLYRKLSSWMFTQNLFRVISFFEIKVTDDLINLNKN